MVQRSDSPMPDALHNYESVLHDSHIEKKKAARLPDSLCLILLLSLARRCVNHVIYTYSYVTLQLLIQVNFAFCKCPFQKQGFQINSSVTSSCGMAGHN